ncbi:MULTISPECIES: hypothetical protein [Streptomyces]|uniref:hypothetical protein n=1 Tax=Streptomyces TaxID=1883 RepID=UPI0022488D3D|nr:hypothetical protein [Streptomyces sp. JHD 1]MCX2969472.1 hypothetical protein [Streptomyces sp. JHD 1]
MGSSLSIPAYGTKLVTRSSRELPAAQVASALEDRVRALAARRPAPPRPAGEVFGYATPPANPGRTR